MKKYSTEAKELLTNAELYEIKAGTSGRDGDDQQPDACTLLCSTCIGCTTSCLACTSKMMDVIPIP